MKVILFMLFQKVKRKLTKLGKKKEIIIILIKKKQKVILIYQLGTPINLRFKSTIGSDIVIRIGLNNTCRDAEVKYCQSLDIPSSLIGKSLKFICNSHELIPDKKIGQSNINNLSVITVLYLHWIIGA